MRTLLLGVLVLTIAACNRQSAEPAPASVQPEIKMDDAPLTPPADTEAAAPADEHPDLAIDEPLPPFEEDSGIVLSSKSVLKPSDAALAISGDVFLYEAPDGSHLLRLENLKTPQDLRIDIAMSHSAAPVSADDAKAAQAVGALKGSSGSMNYLLEGGTDVKGVQAFVLLDHSQPRVLAVAPFKKP